MGTPVDVFIERYKALGLKGSPWTARQVKALEQHLGFLLPSSYQAYLMIAGDSPPPALTGSDCHADYLFDLREWGEELLGECGNPFKLPDHAVVFLMHQGYQFLYFDADGINEDPPVFFYFENWTAAEKRYDCFSDWVERGSYE